jgi:segregation and condensation protein A
VEIQRIEEMQVMRAAVAWLQQRPQLRWDVFTRPPPEDTRDVGYVALMEACLVLLRGKPGTGAFAPPPMYRQMIPDLWRIGDAMERIEKMLPDYPGGAAMGAFMPRIPVEETNRTLKARAAAASTFAAGLELAKQEVLRVDQPALFGSITYHPAPKTTAMPDQKRERCWNARSTRLSRQGHLSGRKPTRRSH